MCSLSGLSDPCSIACVALGVNFTSCFEPQRATATSGLRSSGIPFGQAGAPVALSVTGLGSEGSIASLFSMQPLNMISNLGTKLRFARSDALVGALSSSPPLVTYNDSPAFQTIGLPICATACIKSLSTGEAWRLIFGVVQDSSNASRTPLPMARMLLASLNCLSTARPWYNEPR